MAKYIHNISGVSKTYEGNEILDNEYFLIPPTLYPDFSINQDLIDDIQNGDVVLSRNGVDDITQIDNNLELLAINKTRISLAVDKNGINQNVSGTTEVTITSDRVLWDLSENYDVSTDDFVIPIDGVYFFDCQFKITNISNVATIELAIYKRGSPDDYWFIIDKQNVSSLSEVQLKGGTTFDFYKDERYTVKIILTKVLPLVACSCTISGDDDYTAWGFVLNEIF